MNLFLDDIRYPKEARAFTGSRNIDLTIYDGKWVIVRSYVEFISCINAYGLPELISFDHDLGDADSHTGMDCAKWLVEYCMDRDKDLPIYVVHSANPVGYHNIMGLLDNFRNVRSKEI